MHFLKQFFSLFHRSALREAEEKIQYAKRLYGFISQINQTIVHVKTEQELFEASCRIAVEQGRFRFAWIGMVDRDTRRITLQASGGATAEDLAFFDDYFYEPGGPIEKVIEGQDYFLLTEEQKRKNAVFQQYADGRGFKSAISLPLRKSGKVIGAFNLYSGEKHFFSQEEITLLREATEDLSFALDVFEKEKQRTLAEQNLKNSELRLSQAQAIAHLGSWEMGFESGEAYWSDEMLRIYGLGPKEHRQSYQSWLSFIHPDDLEEVKKNIKAAEPTLDNASFYHRIIRPDGSLRHVFSQTYYELNADGDPIGLNGAVHDVTERKIAEQAMLQSQMNLRLIVDSIPQSVFAKDYTGKYVFVNKNFAALYGLTPKELVNRNVQEILPEKNDLEEILAQDREVMRSGQVKIIPELQFADHTGKERIFYTTKLPYTTAGKNVKAVLGIALDVTEQKHADSERSKMIAHIVQRNKDLEQFSYIVSHNLRAPVANIIGLAEELNHGRHEPQMKNMLIAELSSSARRIDNIIVDLNSILRVREISENSESVNLAELVENIQFSIQHLMQQENVQIVTDFEALPEIVTIKSYMHSIFYNLISNSIKYHQPGLAPQISIKAKRKANGKLVIAFKDNGTGIDLNTKKDQVFGLYKRFHSNIEGKGMGLFMVKTQVETLGGRISIESEINKGTSFRIEFDS